ncbi:MAG: nickel transporter [Hyphomicrobiales bacterium]|nr:nickel transporter [Hyphomicrobiales bacterium]MBV9520921.1 nickel transporter [Hyphomicrobiales bacterium]
MSLHIIPVIDLRRGLVVRAVMGRRELYRPIETPLSRSADPEDVVRGLMTLHPFTTIYVADLDAIEGTGDNTDVVGRLRKRFAHLDIWTDNGIAASDEIRAWLATGRGTLVLGSESQMDSLVARSFKHDARLVLSLDFRESGFQGPAELLDPLHWPQRIIAMTLARVGGVGGPDFERLAELRHLGPRQRLYAAGGVRGREDLRRLTEMGVTGVLIASALHDGRLTENVITEFAGR